MQCLVVEFSGWSKYEFSLLESEIVVSIVGEDLSSHNSSITSFPLYMKSMYFLWS